MKSRQVGFVLIALIAIGLAGLVVRVISSDPSEVVLSGLLPISQDVVDSVQIGSDKGTSKATLVRKGETWTVNNQPAFQPKLNLLWTAVADIQSNAQLIAANPKNHQRMGVAEGQGTVVSFFLGDFEQEKLLIGKWTPEVGLCYVRRFGKNEVYGIPCPPPVSAGEIFDSQPDGWLDPVILRVPRSEVESITFSYPDEEFDLRFSGNDWVVVDESGENPADLVQVDTALRVLELLFAEGFATAEESKGLNFDTPTASVRIVTKTGSSSPTTRLRILERDDLTYYVKTPVRPTVFIVNRNLIDLLLKTKSDLLTEDAG